MNQRFVAQRWPNALHKAARWLEEHPNAILERLEVEEGDYPVLVLHYRFSDEEDEEQGEAAARLERLICRFTGYGNAKSLTPAQRRLLRAFIPAIEGNRYVQRPSLLERFIQDEEAFIAAVRYCATKQGGKPSATKLISALRTHFERAPSAPDDALWK